MEQCSRAIAGLPIKSLNSGWSTKDLGRISVAERLVALQDKSGGIFCYGRNMRWLIDSIVEHGRCGGMRKRKRRRISWVRLVLRWEFIYPGLHSLNPYEFSIYRSYCWPNEWGSEDINWAAQINQFRPRIFVISRHLNSAVPICHYAAGPYVIRVDETSLTRSQQLSLGWN